MGQLSDLVILLIVIFIHSSAQNRKNPCLYEASSGGRQMIDKSIKYTFYRFYCKVLEK